MSPTARSMAYLRDAGYSLVWLVEHWNCFSRRKQDLWGFVDVLALRRDEVLGVQATSYGNVAARVRKINEHPNVGAVREAGISIKVFGWRKVKGRWRLREVDCS